MPPAAIITPALLKSLRTHPHLPSHTWYFIASVTLSALNRPDEIPHVFNHALEHDFGRPENGTPAHADQLRIVRRIREGLVKSSAVVGMPKVRFQTALHSTPLPTLLSLSPARRNG